MIVDIVKVFLPAVLAFCIGVLITPPISDFLYSKKMWKKKAGKVDLSGNETPIFNKLHEQKEVGTPRMGGVIVWLSSLITILLVWVISLFLSTDTTLKLDFLSRSQTWIPLFTLIAGSLVGLLDDYMEVKGSKDNKAGGLSLKKRLLVVGAIGLFWGAWFFFKLDVSTIGTPGIISDWNLGWLFVPFFALVTLIIYSGGIIDGLDGLSGGIFATMYTAYAGIAFYQQQINLAAFCLMVVGAILAFLWFNIPPARFYMSETGMMGLTITLAVVAFMTDSLAGGYGIMVLPIIALPLLLTTASVVIQVASKKLRHGKKVFLVAPIHHHFEAIGWPAYKVTMRFWIVGIVVAIVGVVFALIG
ncbi:MAG: hypothetical protein A2653_02475 [Candidatus Zambryskibacteria bacterium RIFCSPHIGHO2_01_FULL_43_25]|uniref:Phospho-N-acetylmuramoyl-pentapeptide-transferase n=1 Tax=Candidatus Zambryskibacteria bacterium RIFCSPLOWO2_01_FULL_45_21 TaxID=1802761 RepID=A0A1G2U4W7_9BACT|nr:MAG: hypothetical protein A2653_02475 [Candidatus Zambryskibacteria bacterium RIFCSPHIGHO2_01_FULL_43_25]OHB01063.1 MAG: hypothetical protein A3E94_02655 [Candidatus Zambryskibacteria bacterium RIFCSPHIGHO2_12_FULL_44_12b]OHB03892.1 MAG: hypothetical protein A3B14_00975 [Candidatus Zambryskibacteria bacterium RIFCSPLOWO2_01_FULL_45_21]